MTTGIPVTYTTMPSSAAAQAANATFAPQYDPVAVFVGGTSGIGQSSHKINYYS